MLAVDGRSRVWPEALQKWRPARRWFPRKGTIQPGSDADLVIYDPKHKGKISSRTQWMNLDYNAFEGMEIKGRPEVVTVRGKVAARNGKFVGDQARGQFLRREPNHF
jgi:dihydropyrimidinase